jgi:hypothetical protein
MRFLTIKKHGRERRDGRDHARAFVVKKDRKFGKVLDQAQIHTRKPVLITGAHASGKSRWLDRLRADASRIWPSRAHAEPLYFAATRPLSAWSDTKPLELWWAGRQATLGEDDRHWSKLKAWERLDALPLYLADTGAVLFVDDAHNLSGRKLKVTQDCVRAAAVFVITAAEENRLSPGLRKDVLGLEPQVFHLDSDVAYDATPVFMWLVILLALATGSYELAAVVGGLRMFASGRRAAKQA